MTVRGPRLRSEEVTLNLIETCKFQENRKLAVPGETLSGTNQILNKFIKIAWTLFNRNGFGKQLSPEMSFNRHFFHAVIVSENLYLMR